MEKVTGRTDDMIILRGVNLFPTQVEEIVLRTAGLSPHFRLVLTTRGRLDHLTVEVEARPDCPPTRRTPAAQEVAATVKDTVGVSLDVVVVDPDTLPRSVGKLQRLLDERDTRMTEQTVAPARRGRPGHSLESLLAVAVAVFNERGYEATSMDELALRAGVTKSAIYHHVPGKEELLRLAVDRALDGLFAVTRGTGGDDRPRDRPARARRPRVGPGPDRRAAVRHPAAAGARQHRRRAGRPAATAGVRPRRPGPRAGGRAGGQRAAGRRPGA